MESKRLLIICYAFPPYPGIGGRRWAKFAKYLTKKGYAIDVICSENPFNSQSQWLNDVSGNKKITVHQLPVKYPQVILKGVNGLGDKIKYRFWKYILQLSSKGTVFERTLFWKKQLSVTIENILAKGDVKNVIVSIPPFRLAYYSVLIKKKYPHINLIVDYRDPWTDNESFHGFKDISKSRLQFEKKMEDKVLVAANAILTVSDTMSEKIKTKVPANCKVVTINNGFDPDDIIAEKDNSIAKDESSITTFIYGGTLYSNLDYIIDPLVSYMAALKEKQKDIYDNILFEFYGEQNPGLSQKIVNSGLEAFKLKGYIDSKQLHKKIDQSSFCLLMSAPDHAFAFNTKFFEYLAHKKPIILFAPPGATGEFIVNNKLGYWVNTNTLQQSLDKLFASLKDILKDYNSGFDTSRFSVENAVVGIESLIK